MGVLALGCEDPTPPTVDPLDAAVPVDVRAVAESSVDATADGGDAMVLPPSALRFEAPTCMPTAPGLTGFALGDVDRDGHIDVALEYRRDATDAGASNGFGYARNETPMGGAVRFATRVDRLSGQQFAAHPRLADLDGDGYVDLVRDARWWPNAGRDAAVFTEATFGGDGRDVVAGVGYTTPDPGTLVTVDFDGDGRRDLASTQWTGECVVMLYPNRDVSGAPAFGVQETVRFFLRPLSRCGSFAVGDLDGDDRPDLVVTSENPDRGSGEQGFAVVRNLTARGDLRGSRFGEPVLFTTAPSGARRVTTHARLADFDGDGALDLFVLTRSPDGPGVRASIRRGVRAMAFTAAMFEPAVELPDGLDAGDVFATDLDGDGDPDLASFANGRAVVLVNQSTRGAALRGEAFAVGAVSWGDGVRAVDFADVDGDRRPDAVLARDASLCVARGLTP